MKLHVSRNGQKLGIFDEEQLTDKLASGEITYDDLGWVEGMTEWLPLRQIVTPPSGSAPPPLSYSYKPKSPLTPNSALPRPAFPPPPQRPAFPEPPRIQSDIPTRGVKGKPINKTSIFIYGGILCLVLASILIFVYWVQSPKNEKNTLNDAINNQKQAMEQYVEALHEEQTGSVPIGNSGITIDGNTIKSQGTPRQDPPVINIK